MAVPPAWHGLGAPAACGRRGGGALRRSRRASRWWRSRAFDRGRRRTARAGGDRISCIVPRSSGSATALLAGLAVLAAIVGWTPPLPIHHRGATCWGGHWCWRGDGRPCWRCRATRWPPHAPSPPPRIRPGRCCWWRPPASPARAVVAQPQLRRQRGAPGWAQLLADARYHFDVQRQAWAVAPWATTSCMRSPRCWPGTSARPWARSGCCRDRRCALAGAGACAPVAVALVAAAVLAAQPFTGYFTTTMQVDGASAAIPLHLAAIAASPAAARPGPWATGAIGGLLLGLKTVNLLFALPLLAWIAWTSPARGRWLARALAIGLAIALPNYAYAWFITGNPLFLFFNVVFRSPLYPLENFRDLKWMAGITWRAPWDLSFPFQPVRPGRAGRRGPGAPGHLCRRCSRQRGRAGRWPGLARGRSPSPHCCSGRCSTYATCSPPTPCWSCSHRRVSPGWPRRAGSWPRCWCWSVDAR